MSFAAPHNFEPISPNLKRRTQYIWRQPNNMPATSYGQTTTGFIELLLV